MQDRLLELEQHGKIRLAPEIHRAAEDVVRDGVMNLGTLHSQKPLRFNKDGNITSSNFRVLYFYHNRLNSYGLAKAVHWKAEEIEVLKID